MLTVHPLFLRLCKRDSGFRPPKDRSTLPPKPATDEEYTMLHQRFLRQVFFLFLGSRLFGLLSHERPMQSQLHADLLCSNNSRVLTGDDSGPDVQEVRVSCS